MNKDNRGGIIPLPDKTQKQIDLYMKNPVGRPPATQEMKRSAKEKQKIRMRLTTQSNRAIKDRNWDKYIKIVDEMYVEGLIGKKAYDNRVVNFVEAKTEVELDDTAEEIAFKAMEDAMREVRIEEGAPVKLKVVEDFSEESTPMSKFTDKKIKKATKKMFELERQASQEKRSQVSEHFTSYDKSKPVLPTTRAKAFSLKAKWEEIPSGVREQIRKSNDYDEGFLKSTWENFVTDDDEAIIAEGNYQHFGDILKTAK